MRLRHLGASLLALTTAASTHAQSRPVDYGAWYLSTYGPALPKDDGERLLIEGAKQVFEKLAGVADRRPSRPPVLLIVEKGGVEAQALPDGTIVVNLGLLRLCQKNSATETGRARLAFVLGHELAHLAHDDSWHAEAFAALRLEKGMQETAALRQAKELHADEAGFKYMVMAGHDPAAVLGGEHDFLSEWMRYDTGSAPGHPTFAKRAQMLRHVLTPIGESVPFFRFGVRLVQLGRPDDAIPLLQRALGALASHEVASNLGLAHYQRALRRLSACGSHDGLRFQLPVALDPVTLAERVQLRSAPPVECSDMAEAREDLVVARDTLRGALERAPEYLPARVNLVCVLLQQGESLEAFGRSKEPGLDEPRDPRLVLLHAIALAGLGRNVPGDAVDGALDRLEGLEERCARVDACGGASAPIIAAATFDRARLQEERGRHAAAVEAWKRFLDLQARGPWAEEARASLRRAGERAGTENTGERSRRPAQVVSLLERLTPAARERLQAATPRQYRLGDLRVATRAADGLEALELRKTIELIEERMDPPSDGAELQRELGPPETVAWLEGDRRTWIYADTAFDIESGRAVRRILFQGR